MTLYFDTKVEFLDIDAVSTICSWHQNEPLFAVALYSQESGGSVGIFLDSCEPQRDVAYPVHATSQVTSLAWHPEKVLLATGWENGEIHVWFAGHREFASVNGPHKAAIIQLEFSEQGGRLVTADALGLVTGWRCDGQYKFLTMFSHDLRDVLLLITFRRTIESEAREEMANLARAAVAGDENALDTLTNWRPRTAARNITLSEVKDNHCFFASTQGGVVYYINQGGSCMEVLKSNMFPPIVQMQWHPKKDAVICMMEDLTVTLYLVESTGILTELDRVKLSGRGMCRNGAIAWAGNSLAIITGDLSVRIWDIEKSDNYLLKSDLPRPYNHNSSATNTFWSQGSTDNIKGQATNTIKANETFTCLAYNTNTQTLCAGTSQGNLYIWKRTVSSFVGGPEDSWQLTNISSVRGAIKHCEWGFNELMKPCILVNCISNVYVLKEQPLLVYHTREISAVQCNANSICVTHCTGVRTTVQIEFVVTAMTLNAYNLIVSNGRIISTYTISKRDKSSNLETHFGDSEAKDDASQTQVQLSIKLIQTFTAECFALNIHNQNIFCLTASDIMIYSIGGVMLNKIQPNDNEGKIIGMDLSASFLTTFTMNGFVKVYDISRHDPKSLFPSKSGFEIFDDFGEFMLAKCNSVGSHLALVIANRNFVPQPVVYCWDFEQSNLIQYALGTESDATETSKSSIPVSIYWDSDEARILAVEMRSILRKDQSSLQATNGGHNATRTLASVKPRNPSQLVESLVLVLFYSDNSKLNVLEPRPLDTGEQLVNLCIPNVVTLDVNAVKEMPLQDFIDLQSCDPNTRKLVLNFSLHIAEGDMDMAYRCIRSIQSQTIWQNLAKMCVKTDRLDVAKVCMGHLDKARSVRALRQAMSDDDLELEAKVAVLAIELGMIKEAQALYTKCGRYDLLNKLQMANGKLDEALAIAESHDRIHLKNTYFYKAQVFKDSGNIKAALEYFEKTQNPVQNVTQLLLEHPHVMKRYMQSTNDPKMLKWWGQYVESSGDMDGALEVYQKAEDCFSQVKIHCFLGQITKADTVARQSGDRAACYHLARHYENIGKFQEAIMFYTRAQTFSNAIRICKENDFQDDLWTVASSTSNRDKGIAATYFEECGDFKRAVELYHRAGMLHKALEMAFESEQPDILEIIASDLMAESDPELIKRCADFFTSIEQHQKAVHLLAKTKHIKRSLQICIDKGVPVTEDLAEMLTPNKNDFDKETRIALLTQLGEILQEQGDYQTAAKKFTQAGDKVRAMKSLLKSGNTDKIIFFANVSRQREVYIMAANYLQLLNWQDDNNILRHIVTFYSKCQAYDSLANFYAICAQLEIDNYNDYAKALNAMQEAAKCLEKLSHTQKAFNNLQRTIADVKTILKIQKFVQDSKNHEAIADCHILLNKPEMLPIRHAHILALLIRAYFAAKQYNEAGRTLKELTVKNPTWSSTELVDKALVQKIAKECNLDFNLLWSSGHQYISMADSDAGHSEDGEIREELHK